MINTIDKNITLERKIHGTQFHIERFTIQTHEYMLKCNGTSERRKREEDHVTEGVELPRYMSF